MPMTSGMTWLAPFVPGPHLRLGAEWLPWWRLAAAVRDVLRRGAFTPTVLYANPGLVPAWQAVPGRSDRRLLGVLAKALSNATLPGAVTPDLLLETFLVMYGDAVVRAATARRSALRAYRQPPKNPAPGDLWVSRLLSSQPKQLPRQSGRVRWSRWNTWLTDPAELHGPSKMVLRVNEPGAEDPDWSISAFLETPSDPGVLVPAEEVWGASSHPLADAALGVADGEALLQSALTAASAFAPSLAQAARDHLGTVPVALEEVWKLLTDAGKLPAGIELRVPNSWRLPPPRANLRMQSAASGLFGAQSLVHFQWEVALGDEVLTAEEFERLVSRRVPLVHLKDGWVVLDRREAEKIRARWQGRGTEGELAAGPALLLAVEAEADEESGTSVELDAVLSRSLQDLAASSQVEEFEPEGFTGQLRPYQRRGLGWLAARASLGLGAVLADDMGLGKTVQVLALIARRRREGITAPTLVVAPTSVVANWALEAEKFTPGLTVLVHQGAARARTEAFAEVVAGADLVVTSYALLLRDAPALTTIPWDGVVLDEAQNVKNASAKQSQAARRLRAHWRLALTGTPVENSLTDLWSIFSFIQPGYLGSAEAFRRRLATRIERDHDERAQDTLRRLIGPLVLRRAKGDPGVVEELPPKIEMIEHCSLTREQAGLYGAVAQDLLDRIESASGMARKAAVLLALLRLKQVCNHPAHFTGDNRPLGGRSGKLDRLEEMLDEVLTSGAKSLVFTQFASFGRRLSAHLAERWPQALVLHLDGATPGVQRAEIVRRFQECPEPAVFVLSLKAGGAGLNLTAAQHVFHFDRWWNPAVERQATDRAYRIGQTQTVYVHKFLCVGTLEERIDALIRSKEALADGLFSGGEAWLTELDDHSLREVLMLRKAVLD